jgi:hypothetical protein
MRKARHVFAAACLIACSFGVLHAQWVQTNGPFGTSSTMFAVAGTTVYAATNEGVFCSSDNGVTWNAAGLASQRIRALLPVGTLLLASTGTELYRSSDNGKTWTESSSGLPNQFVSALCLFENTLFAGTYGGGIYRSADNGVTWTAASPTLTRQRVAALTVTGTHLFAAIQDGASGVYVAADHGTTWTLADAGATVMNVCSLIAKDSTLYAGCSGGQLYRSVNFGSSWTLVKQFSTDSEVAALAAIGTTVYAGTMGTGVYRSDDNGVKWTGAGAGLTDSSTHTLALIGSTVLAGTYSGVYRSTNKGASWSVSNNGLAYKNVRCLAMSADGKYMFAGTDDGGVHRSSTNGTAWDAANTGMKGSDGRPVAVLGLAVLGTTVYAATYGEGVVYKSTDNAATWTSIGAGLPSLNVSSLYASGKYVYAGPSGGGLYRRANADSVWTKSDAGLPPAAAITTMVDNTQYFFAGTIVNGIYRSGDNGASWQNASTGLPSSCWIKSLAASPAASSQKIIVAGTNDQGIYKSADNGASWTAEEKNLMLYRNVCSLAYTENGLFAGTAGYGAFLTPAVGSAWWEFNPGLTDKWVNDLKFNKNTGVIYSALTAGNLFAATEHGGVFRYGMTGSLIANLSVKVPVKVTAGTAFWVEVRIGEPNAVKGLYGISFKLRSSQPTCSYVNGTGISGNFLGTGELSLIRKAGSQAVDVGITKSAKPGMNGSGLIAKAMFVSTTTGPVELSLQDLVVVEEKGMLIPVDTAVAAVAPTVVLPSIKSLPLPPYTAGKNFWIQVRMGDPDVQGLHDLSFRLKSSKAACTYVAGSGRMDGLIAPYGTASFAVIDAQTVGMNLSTTLPVGVTGSGVVARAQFVCPPSGDVNFSFTDVVAKDKNGRTIPLTLSAAGITVTTSTRLPILNEKFPQTMAEIGVNTPATFYVSVTDPDGLPLTYIWKVNGVVKQVGDSIFTWIMTDTSAARTGLLKTGAAAPSVVCVFQDAGGKQDSTVWEVVVTSAPHERTLPQQFALNQNYPNPFNPSTTISFSLPSRSFVSLNVFDVMGRCVTTLASEELPAGIHSRHWEASGYPSGVYFYRLQTDSHAATKRLLLLK